MPLPDLTSAQSVAMEAIRLAAEYVRNHQPTSVSNKGDRDIVTDVDVTVERIIYEVLRDWNPALGFLGEERGHSGDETTFWVVDPIDGTINLSHGSDVCAIALALVHEHRPVIGVTCLPFNERFYWAADGQGAYLNGEPIEVSATRRLEDALIGMCDYGSGRYANIRDPLCIEVDRRLTAQAQGVRRRGSTAVDLISVAEGSLDACVLFGNNTWDTSSGAIIAREAGALVLDADGSPHNTLSRSMLATTPALEDVLLPMMDVARGTRYAP